VIRVVLLAVVALLLVPVSALADGEPEWGFTELDGVELGEQLVGPRLSEYDLRGKVVVLYQWCITCPISTGAFPSMNRLNERWRDRGVEVVGFQVRRDPDVLAENVRWYLDHLRPNFPVARLGNDWEWPARILPWVVVFDHTGKRVYGGSAGGLETRLTELVAKTPDWLVGGPYEALADRAAAIAADREKAGRHLPAVRKLAAGDGPEAAEAKAMLAHVERWFGWQLAKAREDMRGPVEEAKVYESLAKRFDGDALGERAAKRLAEVRADPGYESEARAHRTLRAAKRLLRRLPPAGRYAYDMTYSLVGDPEIRAARSRLIAEFRVATRTLRAGHPKSRAARDARGILFELDAPELTEAEAKALAERAGKLLAPDANPIRGFDGRIALVELEEGWFGSGGISALADGLRAAWDGRPAEERERAREVYFEIRAAEDRIREAVRAGGSMLPREEAERRISEMERLAKSAGPHCRIAERSAAWAERLRKSYDGPADLGVIFDRRYEGEGLRVRYVYPHRAAEAAGLRPGDVLLELDDVKIRRASDLSTAVGALKPGMEIGAAIRRDGEERRLPLVLGRRP